MASQLSNGKGKRAGGQVARLVKLAQSQPLAAGGALVLVIVGTIFFLQGTHVVQGSKGSPLGTPSRSHQGDAASGRARLLEQNELLQDADKLVEEVSELARELDALQSGVDPSLTLRERLWQMKEAAEKNGGSDNAGTTGDESGTSDSESSDSASGNTGSSSDDATTRPGRSIPEQLQQLLLANKKRWDEQLEANAQLLVTAGNSGGTRGKLAGANAGAGLSSQLPVEPRMDPVVVELSDKEVARRREEIVEAMRHAWGGYVEYAWGHDELAPVSKKGKDGFGGLGATIIDSLDTLLMMGMKEEYKRGLDWISNEMQIEAPFDASVFETIIRVVGGFLAAYEMTGDEILLRKSEEVAQRLMPAYNTTTGIPFNTINLQTQKTKNPNWNQKASTLAEFGTHQLEFFKLSQKTGNTSYQEKAEATIKFLYDRNPGQGLMPLFVNPTTGRFTNRKVSFGALGDSYYEYLLKLWVLKGQPANDMFREMWEQAMDEMIDRLLFTSKEGFQYIAEFDRYQVKHKMDHLVCFVPGMLSLGVYHGAVSGAKADKYMDVAANVTHTCWQMYHTQPTGLSPEYVMFTVNGLRVGAAYNMLRPEALEAFWYMWRMTRDWKYRTWAWEVFQVFQQHCRTEAGYSGVKDVRKMNVTHDDTQQSFFLAETLKYLYLIFSPDDALDWDEWVLNTEAHPLRIVARKPKAHKEETKQQRKKSRFMFGLFWRRKT